MNSYTTTPPPTLRSRFSLTGSTAYNGSEGHIHDGIVRSGDRDHDGFDAVRLPDLSRSSTPARPALGSRLLSGLSNAQPAAKLLPHSGSMLHSRARSLASFMPRLSTTTTTPPPPQEKDKAPQAQPNNLFGDLFNGESAPIRLGIPTSSPTKENDETEFIMDYRPTLTERPVRMHGGARRQSTTPPSNINNASNPSRKSSWLSRKPSVAVPLQLPDDILDININLALFPHGPADPLSPHAFNELLLNATNLLQRMQSAYKEKVDFIASIQPEIDVQREEVEEAETRAQHLKMQLEDLARRAQDQEMAMREMGEQLAREKIHALEAKEAAAHQTARLVGKVTESGGNAPSRRRARGSAGTASDSGFESDAEYADSEASGHGGAEAPLTPPPAVMIMPSQQHWSDRMSTLSRQSTMTVSSASAAGSKRFSGPDDPAWATLEQLRRENYDLKRRMEEMQRALQQAIDIVGSVHARR